MKLKNLLVLLLLLGSAFVLSACSGSEGPRESGAQGESSSTGDKGPAGEKGPAGDKGPTGDTGEAGANGVQIEFSFTSEGLAWRYVGETEWNIGITFNEIYTVVNEYEVGPIIKAHGFDIVVDSSYAHLAAGAEQTVFGEALVYGETLFGDLESAFAAAKVASEAEGYEGLQIFINKGEYAAARLEASNVELFGPNVGVDPNDASVLRVGEATFIEPVVIAGDNVVVDGIAVDQSGKIKLAPEGGVDNLTIQNVFFMSTSIYDSSEDGRIELIWATDDDGKYIAGEDYTNLVVKNSRFEGNGRRLQNIHGMQLNGLQVLNCVFLGSNKGVFDDCIKLYESYTYSIKGEVLVEGNVFANFTQYSVWLLNYGPGNYVVRANKFENCGLADTQYNRGTLTINSPATSLFFNTKEEKVVDADGNPVLDENGAEQFTTVLDKENPIEGAKAIVTYTKNEVVSSSLGARIGYAGLVEGQIEAKVNYNVFEQIVKTDRIVTNENTNTFAAINAENNFFDIEVSDANFIGVNAWSKLNTREEALQ